MPEPTPVLLVAGEYPPDRGGVADYTVRLRAALAQHGIESAVLTRARSPEAEASVHRLVRTWNAASLGLLARLPARSSIVHLQYQAAAFGLRGEMCLAPSVLRLLRPDVRVVTTFHDARVPYLFPRAGRLRRAAVGVMARFSHAVLAADSTDLRQLGGPSPRHHHVPIGTNVPCRPPAGFDREAVRRGLGLHPGALAVGYFGFLNASKGLETLLKTFEQVGCQEPSARLVLLGGATGASDPTDGGTAAAFATRLQPFAGRVARLGYLAPEQLSAHLLALDVALLPYQDGASLRRGSLLACAEHGLPIITTTGVGLESPLADAVLAAPPGDARALAQAVLAVAKDAALRRRLAQGSARLARAVHWEEIARRHVEIYAAVGAR